MAEPTSSSDAAAVQPLLETPASQPSTPRIGALRWTLAGFVAFIGAVGLAQLVFAILWHGDTVGLGLGVAVEAVVVFILFTLLRPNPSLLSQDEEKIDGEESVTPPKSCLGSCLKHTSLSLIIVPLVLFLMLRVAVHHASPDIVLNGFPLECPPNKLEGCNRVALMAPHNNAVNRTRLEVFAVSTPGAELAASVDAFMASWPRTTVLLRVNNTHNSTYWHARATSKLWSFADDFSVRVICIKEGMGRLSIAEMQGVLRIGVGDMDVNYLRNAALLKWLNDAKARGEFPDHDGC